VTGEEPAAVVTGGANGLGAVIVQALHDADYRVVIADTDRVAAERLAATLGPRALAVETDMRDPASVEATLDRAMSAFGLPWLWVNNACVMGARPVLDITPEEFDLALAVNLRGTFLGCQRFARRLRDAGRSGRIVNIGSLAGQNGGSATGAHYAASKGGVHTLGKVFARDLAPLGITVNTISPGPLDLPSVARTIGADRVDAVRRMIPTGDFIPAASVARMVVELARPDQGGMTGATIDMNGGLYLR